MKRIISTLIGLAIAAGFALTAFAADSPAQVTAHFGNDASTEINIAFTTKDQAISSLRYYPVKNEAAAQTARCTNSKSAGKLFHRAALTGLQPGTEYAYAIGEGDTAFKGTFKTAPARGNKGTFNFALLSDTQVNSADDAKALGANLQQVADGKYDFVFLAGDHTDTALDETQWEQLFANGGAFPQGGQNLFGSTAVAVVQGNHDNANFSGHYAVPAQAGKAVYAFDYGPATFIALNLESTVLSPVERNKQANFLRGAVKEARARGQWVMVGFHKSLYTGASHIVDADVIAARKFWGPLLAELDVDLVLQGHDHVYARGFVRADGNKAVDAPKGTAVASPDNAPLYVVAGHAGGLKWYSKENYAAGRGDPLVPGYAFLDVNSADDGSDEKKEQWIVGFKVSENTIAITTRASKYDVNAGKITTPGYTYDTLTITRRSAVVPPPQTGDVSDVLIPVLGVLMLAAAGVLLQLGRKRGEEI